VIGLAIAAFSVAIAALIGKGQPMVCCVRLVVVAACSLGLATSSVLDVPAASAAPAPPRGPAATTSGGRVGAPGTPDRARRPSSTSRGARISSHPKTSTAERVRGGGAKRTSKSKGKRKHREESRVPNRRTATNMPKGWRWPPTRAMIEAGKKCTDDLDAVGIEWKPAAREGRVVTPIELASMELGGIEYHSVFRKPPFIMDCHLALALATHSTVLYDLGVRKVNFGSIYRYTKVRAFGKTKNVLSRHALGLAMDVVSFEGADGVVANVEKDYPIGDELLLSIEDTLNGTGGFRTVLTPRNDPKSHHDHFHIEAAITYYEDERNLAALRGEDPEPDAADEDGEPAGEDRAGEAGEAPLAGDRRKAVGAPADDDLGLGIPAPGASAR
jgi:hypothetical protein